MGGRASCLQIRKRCETLRAGSMPPSTRRAGRLGRRLAMTDRQSTHGHDCWSWGPKHYECAVREIERLAAQLTAAQQRPVEDGCHCGTCTCNTNMTQAVRFDLSPAQTEGAIREHLIRLGWTPPDEAEALR